MARPAEVPALRERVRRTIRKELADAAWKLFAEKGFDDTRVDDIVALVGVSQRTFFRYFPTKDDVILRWGERNRTVVIAALAARPPRESPLVALRRSFDAMADLPPKERRRVIAVGRLEDASAAVHRAIHAIQAVWEEQTAAVLGQRMGVDPATDIRPVLLAATSLSTVRVCLAHWRRQPDPNGAELARLLDDGFRLLGNPSRT